MVHDKLTTVSQGDSAYQGLKKRVHLLLDPEVNTGWAKVVNYIIVTLMLFFRFLKLGRYMHASKVIGRVVKEKKEELTVSLLLFCFLIMLASCLMYYTEHKVQPEKFSNIPQTMWWSVCTLTTVGYGDM